MKKFSIPFCILILLSLGIGMRGGIQQIPINESSAYYSSNLVNNHVATNQLWYLLHNIIATEKDELRQFHFMDNANAKVERAALFPACNLPIKKILESNNPNIVLIMVESLTANVVGSFSGKKGITPFIDSLATNGLIFTRTYSSGFRTDQGLVSIFSGFPSQPGHSIIRIPSKFEKLPYISTELYNKGYHNSFFYGGESNFDNMEAYLRSGNIDHIVNEKSFSKNQQNSKWGAHDEFVFDKMYNTLSSESQPFFATILTLTNHEPFELPGTRASADTDGENFRLTAAYTDLCISNFMRKASTQPWFNNTLFILVADHGHSLPDQVDINSPAGRHIPFIFYGNVLKDEYKGTKVERIASQHDLARTLLNQLNINSEAFKWSRDLLCMSDTSSYAFITSDQGFTWVDDSCSVASYTTVDHPVVYYTKGEKVNVNQRIRKGQAYIQCLFNEYVNY